MRTPIFILLVLLSSTTGVRNAQIQYLETRTDEHQGHLIVHLDPTYPADRVHLETNPDEPRHVAVVFPNIRFSPTKVQLTRLECLLSWNIRSIESPTVSTKLILDLAPDCRAQLTTAQGVVTVTFERVSPSASLQSYRLGPDDVLAIEIAAQPALNTRVRVDKDGTVVLPIVGMIHVEGKTTEQLGEELNDAFAEFYPDPGVRVTVVRYGHLWVTIEGAVHRPGKVTIQPNTTLAEVIREAGGLLEKAAREIEVIHPHPDGTTETEIVLPEQQPFFIVRPGDRIHVPTARFIYITGEVEHPGTYAWTRDMTLQTVLDMAGGLRDTASSQIFVIRTRDDHTETLTLTLPDDPEDPVWNTPIEPNDVIRVPRGKPKPSEEKPPTDRDSNIRIQSFNWVRR